MIILLRHNLIDFGLTTTQEKILTDIFLTNLITGQVIIYGSRVKGNYTNHSDVDLVLKNSQLNAYQLADLIDEILESDFPYLCDIQLFERINNPALISHIERLGKVFYQADK